MVTSAPLPELARLTLSSKLGDFGAGADALVDCMDP